MHLWQHNSPFFFERVPSESKTRPASTRPAGNKRSFHAWASRAYFAIITLLFIALGWLVFGPLAAALALGVAVFMGAAGGRLPLSYVLGLRGARRLSPFEAPDLYNRVAKLSRRAGLAHPVDLYLFPSYQAQAFSTASGHEQAVSLSLGLLYRLDHDELDGVLSHELTHLVNEDTRIMSMAQMMSQLTQSTAVVGWVMAAFGMLLGFATLPPLAFLGLIVAPTLSRLVALALSRSREFDADRGAAQLTGNPLALARALAKLEHEQRGYLRALLGGAELRLPRLLLTHPSAEERIARLRALHDQR